VPFPIQSGSISDRLRKFFRIRGKTSFTLDEVVAPVVLVQDLTKGPYQAGVTPCAGQITWVAIDALTASAIVLLNDKPGSLTPVLDHQFKDRSFSITHIELQNVGAAIIIEDDLNVVLVKRADVVALGVPTGSAELTSIQNNDGTRDVPVHIFGYNNSSPPGHIIWRGVLGDNINTPGTWRSIEPSPEVTLGPGDGLALISDTSGLLATRTIYWSIRGFYQEQPA